MGMHRLFVAIRPPETVRDLLLDLMEGADIRWQENEQLHLTLRFIGEVERPVAEDLADALSKISFPAFALRLKGVGRFDHGRRGALWAGIQPVDEVKALARKIDRACQAAGLKPDRRAYHPHITLARWSGEAAGIDGFIERNAGLASEPWKVGEFLLFESRLLRAGAHYDEILRIHLS
jgi:2'-5' RNA ligase